MRHLCKTTITSVYKLNSEMFYKVSQEQEEEEQQQQEQQQQEQQLTNS